MHKTSAILNKYEREITVLRLDLDFQKSKLEDTNTLLEEQLNHFHEDDSEDPVELLKAPLGPKTFE